MNDELP